MDSPRVQSATKTQNGWPSGSAYAQCLRHIVCAVEAKGAAEREHPLVSRVELGAVADGQVQVELLRHVRGGPGRVGQILDLLHCDHPNAVGPGEIQPVAAGRVVRSGSRRLMTRQVIETEKLAPELRRRACVGAVDHDLTQPRYDVAHSPGS